MTTTIPALALIMCSWQTCKVLEKGKLYGCTPERHASLKELQKELVQRIDSVGIIFHCVTEFTDAKGKRIAIPSH